MVSCPNSVKVRVTSNIAVICTGIHIMLPNLFLFIKSVEISNRRIVVALATTSPFKIIQEGNNVVSQAILVIHQGVAVDLSEQSFTGHYQFTP